MRLALLLVATVLLALVDAARAHDPGLSSAHLTRHADRIETRLELHDDDLVGLDLGALAPRALTVSSDADALAPISVRVAPTRESHTGIHLVHRIDPGSKPTAVLALIDRLPVGHKTYLRVDGPDGSLLSERVLSAEAASVIVPPVEGGSPRAGVAWHFFALGVEHILIGFDHLLFLFVLLLGCVRFGEAARVVTAFTVAHSLTLAAATLGWLRIPPDVVEPLIAASIVYMAGLALLSGGRSRERVAVTFVFGLIHGLGFAGALDQLGIGSGGSLIASLLSFNLGVEVGQLAIAALVLPALLLLRRAPVFGRLGVPACAGLAGAVGLAWLAERTIGI